MIKIPKINTKNTIRQQLSKINSEREECLTELFNYKFYKAQGFETSTIMFEKQMQMEALDTLTAAYNLCAMLGIPKETYDKWYVKMLEYEKTKGYEIEKWITLEEE